MKTLTDILASPNMDKLAPLPYSWDLGDYMAFYEITESTLTDNHIDHFMRSGWLRDQEKFRAPHCEAALCPHLILNEMLKSHDVKYLVNEIKHTFGHIYKTYVVKNVEDDGDRAWVVLRKDIYIKDRDKLSILLDKYMWVCTEAREYEDKYVTMSLEKVLAENITDYVKRKCSNHIYHVAYKYDVDSIDRSGIRPRGEHESNNSKRANRYYPNRVYCIVAPDSEKAKLAISKIKDDKGYSWNDVVIYKIDISKYGTELQFYRDPQTNPIACAAYTYTMFPPKLIKRVKFNEI